MDMGWGVMTVWECQLKLDVREKTLKEIEYWINKISLSVCNPQALSRIS